MGAAHASHDHEAHDHGAADDDHGEHHSGSPDTTQRVLLALAMLWLLGGWLVPLFAT